jgi:hypothetical protein
VPQHCGVSKVAYSGLICKLKTGWILDSAGHVSEPGSIISQAHGSIDKGIFRYMSLRTIVAVFFAITVPASLISAQAIGRTAVRARALGVPFDGSPGALDAITDVKGIEVGNTTLISGNGALKVGEGPIRTGVTTIFPRGRNDGDPVYAGWFSLNGNGEMTGTTWVEESGFLEGPIALTNTHSVGVVRDSIIAWSLKHDRLQQPWSLPVVAETWDGWLNDINGFHVKPGDVFSALDTARGGPVPEGNVGGGQASSVMDSRAAPALRPAYCLKQKAAIQWECWCSATAGGAPN